MKKIFTIALAVAAFAACNKSEVVETAPAAAIAFDNAFVNNATKAADITQDNLFDFGVYGFVQANNTEGQIFKNQRVYNQGSAYVYSPAQYWIGGAQYYFTAIAPYTSAAWTYTTADAQNGTITLDNAKAGANQDILFAYVKPSKTPETITAAPAKVAFAFDHMLARVRFTFSNQFGEGSNIELKVTDVVITDAYKTGELAVVNGVVAEAWTPADKTLNVAFGNAGSAAIAENGGSAVTEHFYLIPANASYNVTFNDELIQAGVSVANYERSATLTYDMKKGYSYDIKANLNPKNTSDDGELYPIEFTVDSVDGWESYTNVDATLSTL